MKAVITNYIFSNDSLQVGVVFFNGTEYVEGKYLLVAVSAIQQNGLLSAAVSAVLAYSVDMAYGLTEADISTSSAKTAPATGDSSKYLKGDGTYGTPAGGSEAFPVGSIFTSVVSTNPATLLGYGTWTAFGAGRVLVGIDAGQTEFDTVEETGGAKTHTLVEAEIPSHTHVQNSHTHTQDAHSHVITSQTATTGGATSYEHGTLDTSSAETEATETTATTVATNQVATAVNQNTGGGGAHNNLQPYIVCYFWKRTV